MPQTETATFYQLYFQQHGLAEREYERDMLRFLTSEFKVDRQQ